MLIATQAQSIEGTAKYFDTTLARGDYYTGAEIAGTWNGKAAAKLGVEVGSEVRSEQFKALLHARHPLTGEKLAQRVKKNRRPGVDLTFSVPKSVSLAWAINEDEQILDILSESVRESITLDVEPLMCRRVRKGKMVDTMHRKQTGNLITADFLHKTSRPVGGKTDPQLHVHSFVLNYTSDEGEHYAAELEEVFRQRPSLQAKYHARLARRLEASGYTVEKVAYSQSGATKEGWELKGVSRKTIEKFSSRTQQIEEHAVENDIRDAEAKGKLGLKTREKKVKGASIRDLRREWRSRLTPAEKAAFQALKNRKQGDGERQNQSVDIAASVRFALDHHLYRQSTVEKHEIVGTALKHSPTLSPESVEAALQAKEILHRKDDVRGAERDYLTTREVLEAEQSMIRFARNGRGRKRPIGSADHVFVRDWLNEEQKSAVRHVLASCDAVTAVTGGAGTGKSSLAEEAVEAIQQNGRKVHFFAPSTGAREVLQKKGFDGAETVEHLIRNTRLHPKLKGQVLWIDEAGLLDVRSMNEIFAIAKNHNARIVLSGDTRQHASPRRGEALRLLESEAGLHAARIDAIQRQRGQYKRAVELISLGHTVVDQKTGMTGLLAGFDMLDRLGKIRVLDDEHRYDVMAQDYQDASKRRKQPLVVAPTHAERHAVTSVLRERLRGAGAIGKSGREVTVLRSLNLSEAEKRDTGSYLQPDLVVQFHQNAQGGYQRGERYRVADSEQGVRSLLPVGDGDPKPLPLGAADRFEVYERTTTEIAVGDKVRFTLGGTSVDGKRISNGRLDQLARFDNNGDLVMESGMRVRGDYGHLDTGYVVTSHAAQGKDSPVAIAAISSQSLPAVNCRQFYVTVSRGKEDVTIYVDDKEAVRRAIQDAGRQKSATELLRMDEPAIVARALGHDPNQKTFMEHARTWWKRYAAGWRQARGARLTAQSPQSPGATHAPQPSRS